MPIDDLPAKWKSFGWIVREIDGHSIDEMKNAFKKSETNKTERNINYNVSEKLILPLTCYKLI